jgi:hypothetical protein
MNNDIAVSKEQREETITITVKQIREALSLLLETCEDRGLTKLTVSHQLYWCVDPTEAFEMKSPYPGLGVGDLFDDAEVLKNIQSLRPGLAGLHFTNIASLLNYIGNSYPSLGPHADTPVGN